MSDGTHIEWTDATWNPVTGCTMVSAGCTNCYAMGLAGTRLRNHPSRAGLTRESGGRHVWTGEVRLNREWLDQPLRWRRPRMIFVCAHGDLFHEEVPDDWIDQVFAVMALAPHHTFQVLTKRPARARAYVQKQSVLGRWPALDYAAIMAATGRWSTPALDLRKGWPLPNVWLGTSVEDQATADARIPDLLATPVAVRFVSAEPLLGPVDLTRIPQPAWTGIDRSFDALRSFYSGGNDRSPRLDWVIVGGESGRDARPMHPNWARSLRDQCRAAGVAFFFKQWGEWGPVVKFLPSWPDDVTCWPDGTIGADGGCNKSGGAGSTLRRLGKKASGRALDGETYSQLPVRPHA